MENDLNSPLKYKDDKQLIRKWLCLSLLKGVFGGQSDGVLTGIRRAIKAELATASAIHSFPLTRIKEEFEENPSKNLSFNDELIKGLLTTQMESADSYVILSLIYNHLNFGNQNYHKDHCHPSSYFYSLKQTDFGSSEDFKFYSDPTNWNSVVNLQLLNGALNQSKLATPLKDWVETNNIDLVNQLIPTDVNLDIGDFKNFIAKRKELLKSTIKRLVN